MLETMFDNNLINAICICDHNRMISDKFDNMRTVRYFHAIIISLHGGVKFPHFPGHSVGH